MVNLNRRRPRGLVAAFATMTLVTLGVGATIATPPLARHYGWSVPGVASATSPSPSSSPSVGASSPSAAASGSPSADATTAPSTPAAGPIPAPEPARATKPVQASVLAQRIAKLPRTQGGRASWLVTDFATGKVLAASGQQTVMLPASNMKTLTSVGVLAALGPDHTFSTRVVSPKPGSIVLVGAGDPTLSCAGHPKRPGAASLVTLADRVAKQLKAEGRTQVTLGYDASLFTGPDWNPTWPAGYGDQTSRIVALACDEGMPIDPKTGKASPRVPDPSADAATRFAALLKARGVTVTGKVAPARQSGAEVAAVESWPLHQQVDWTMVHSDNFAAEVLLRHVGIAGGHGGSFAGGAKALVAQLTRLGIWQPGAVIVDGSGLSRSNRVSTGMLAKAWHVAGHDPQLAPLLTTTPVAGATGTLADRFFVDQGGAPGRGWVHAKTGTLTGVSTLSGWTTTASGQPVIVAMIVNDSTNDWWARVWIDQVASTVTACGC